MREIGTDNSEQTIKDKEDDFTLRKENLSLSEAESETVAKKSTDKEESQASQDKKIEQKGKERKNWLWPSKEEIEEKVKKYHQTKWYASDRMILVWFLLAFMALQPILGFLDVYQEDIKFTFLGWLIYLPVMFLFTFLCLKGYRIGYVLVLLWWTVEKGGAVYSEFLKNNVPLSYLSGYFFGAFLMWLLVSSVCLTCIRVETARKKQGKILYHPVRDTFIAVGLFIFGSLPFIGWASVLQNNQNENEISALIMLYVYTKAYPRYCVAQGYEMQNYPHVFVQHYEKEIITFAEYYSQQYDMSLEQGMEQVITLETEREIFYLIDENARNIYRAFVLSYLSENKGIPLEEIQWTQEMEDSLDMKDFCQIMDMEAESFIGEGILPSDSFKEDFSSALHEVLTAF